MEHSFAQISLLDGGAAHARLLGTGRLLGDSVSGARPRPCRPPQGLSPLARRTAGGQRALSVGRSARGGLPRGPQSPQPDASAGALMTEAPLPCPGRPGWWAVAQRPGDRTPPPCGPALQQDGEGRARLLQVPRPTPHSAATVQEEQGVGVASSEGQPGPRAGISLGQQAGLLARRRRQWGRGRGVGRKEGLRETLGVLPGEL